MKKTTHKQHERPQRCAVRARRGVTLIELMVVIVILSILSTIAVGVYSREVERSRVASARAEIYALEVAINRYEVDNGQYPLSGSGPGVAGTVTLPSAASLTEGSGYAQMSLRGSLNADQLNPLSALWNGPYMDWDENDLGTLDGSATTNPGELNFLDPWGRPYRYVRSREYGEAITLSDMGVEAAGTLLPAGSPYAGTEIYYNASTFQIYSLGPDGMTGGAGDRGTDPDDIANWEGPKL